MAAREQQPRKFGDELGRVLGSLDSGGFGRAKARVASAWHEVAGPQIGKHTSGAFLREGDLVIYVDSPVWATELQAMAEEFRKAINSEIGEDLVSGLRFVVSKRVGRDAAFARQEEAAERAYGPEPVAEVELSETERETLEEEASEVGDPTLREAILRARTAAFLWKKGSIALKSPQKPRE